MKEATGELNMTVITVIAIAAIGGFLMFFLPQIINTIKANWEKSQQCYDYEGKVIQCEK